MRLLPSPQPVRRAIWSDGQIEAWVRDTGTGAWYAKFRDPTGLVSLVFGHDVRPIKDAPRQRVGPHTADISMDSR